MSTWNAIYFHGEWPAGFRPLVAGNCVGRRVAGWLELALPGVELGEPTALELSKRVEGVVIAVLVQTTASVLSVAHFEGGAVRRRIEFADGSWWSIEGEPQSWEAWLFSDAELEEARAIGDPDDDAELERAFARGRLAVDDRLPWPREWEAMFQSIGVDRASWGRAQTGPVVLVVAGSRTSRTTWIARGGLVASVVAGAALVLTRHPDFVAVAAGCGLVACGAGYMRRVTTGRWFL